MKEAQRSEPLTRGPEYQNGSLAGRTDRTTQTNLAVIDSYIETAVRIGTNPRFVCDRSAVSSVIAQRDKNTVVALSAIRK
jgi:hypothetical protein